MKHLLTFLTFLLPVATVSAQNYESWKVGLHQQWKDSVRTAMQEAYDKQALTINDQTMRLHWQVFGQKPADGRSLFISLHGGGGAPAELNDSQWKNQWYLYSPEEGVYLCPRPPFNTWDLHFQPLCQQFYELVIHMMVAFLDVNPDKVYVMGYSAGGDGVWRLATRMTDHWAAASMMAGHPGDVSLLNLRNLPFMVWCGELDAAYDRNKECQKKIDLLDSLNNADPEGYVHQGHIVKGKYHWMDRTDTVAVNWMAQFKRNTCPERIVWQQEEVLSPYFYYLSCPENEMQRGKQVILNRKNNKFFIERCDYSYLIIALDPAVIDFRKKVQVYFNGKRIYNAKPRPSLQIMRKNLNLRQDLSYALPADILVHPGP